MENLALAAQLSEMSGQPLEACSQVLKITEGNMQLALDILLDQQQQAPPAARAHPSPRPLTASTEAEPLSSSSLAGPPAITIYRKAGQQLPVPTAQPSKLSDLFKPPLDLVFKGDFIQAREEACKKSKWLIVNLQDTEQFLCQMLNRDTWSCEALKDLIREKFIFWQVYKRSSGCDWFLGKYMSGQCPVFPYVCIIDPRTGARLTTWSSFITPEEMITKLTHFTDEHSLDSLAVPKVKSSKKDLFEQQMLEQAIKESLVGSGGASSAGSVGTTLHIGLS
eukprot:CAMPEP_0177644080 /NCGR_PEP_ID=MMETSP0447-20121125/8489_1 /TAXON_ID=0 /ORGANISM="Stygamoeba regulata, Strain BSH-02190019" /LENGTH=278 /DNA_ID=CAMNT_0019146401 /DNA_START=141 /DNA_END=974 /DNA_ORIENTATION=+